MFYISPTIGYYEGDRLDSADAAVPRRPAPGMAWDADAATWYAPPVPYDQARREAILAAWPVHAQLEAITELAASRPEKMEQLQVDIAAIKIQFPS